MIFKSQPNYDYTWSDESDPEESSSRINRIVTSGNNVGHLSSTRIPPKRVSHHLQQKGNYGVTSLSTQFGSAA